MKRSQELLGVVLLGGIILILALSTLFAEQKDGQVRITDTRIDIRPETKISESDLKALNKVLNKYDTSLYKIETLKDGKVVTDKSQGKLAQGKLEDKRIDSKLAAEVKQAKAVGASVHTEQVVDIRHTQAPEVEVAKAKELINALKPILEKYSKK